PKSAASRLEALTGNGSGTKVLSVKPASCSGPVLDGGGSGQTAAPVTLMAVGSRPARPVSLLPKRGIGSASPANLVSLWMVPCSKGPAPSTQVSLAELLAWTTPDCQTGCPVMRL